MAPKIVLISGCSSGIGLATAVHLAQDEEKRFKVYATMRNMAKKGKLEDEGKEYLGDTLVIKQMDVCSDESVDKAVKEILDSEGKVDVLFNNAGFSVTSVMECIPINMAQEMMDTNFFGTLRLVNAVLPSMKAKESGHIIQCGSELGIVGMPFFEIYSATKFAVEGLTESLAPMLRQFNIRCTLLEPGPVKTSVAENSIAWGKSIDISTADQKTQDMLKLCSEHLGRWVATALEANDVALIVKEIILGQNTNFRCQTNVDFLAPEIAAKLKDPASNEPIDMLENRLYGKK
ncbi:retinol dehydrogenase 8-like [Montipora foliosa]|uniref:retinol dehydrogenase 8-like n=1 Tax=Montipora foliosa TaxID=591990 RepID=UPI0035F0FB27